MTAKRFKRLMMAQGSDRNSAETTPDLTFYGVDEQNRHIESVGYGVFDKHNK